ncbi:MAG: haloacid dehalogenase-like hydrolase [Patescibacteria group bacterium]
MKSSKKLAVFDIDGTVFRGSFMIELMKTLVHFGVFPREAEHAVDKEYFDWVERRAPYQNYVDKVVGVFTKFIKGCREEDIKKYSARIASYFKNRNYVFTKRLAEKLRKTHFLLSISGSPIEVVQEYNKYLKFDVAFGTIYELDLKTKKYTGKMLLDGAHKKEKIFCEFCQKNGFDFRNSIGVGDTEYDATFLKKVGRPIVFNPNANLLKLARKNNWEIVLERKDVVYKIKNNKCIEVDSYY